MCTLTYIPGRQQAMITVNRDEAPLRAARQPEIREVGGRQFWLAPEPISGSSNTVLDIINRRLHVLLNGAFTAHDHQPPYRISRGVMLFEAFDFGSLAGMSKSYNFQGIEPFTLLSFQDGQWEELRWDGSDLHLTQPDPAAHAIWSSTKLYPPAEISDRERAFHEFVKNSRAVYPQQLFDIHTRDQKDPRGFGFRMNYQDLVRTVSVTQLLFGSDRIMLRYLDLEQRPREILERSF